MRRLVTLPLLLVLVAAGACGGDSSTSGSEARATLTAAVARTLKAKSFHMVISGSTTGEDAQSSPSAIDFVAPDRARSVESGDSAETLYIKHEIYLAEPETDGQWTVATTPGAKSSVDNLLFPLRSLEDPEKVEATGNELAVDLKGASGSARVRIERGYVTRVQLKFGTGADALDVVYTLSGFDREFPPITAPPADQVSQATAPPPCDSAPATPSTTLTICTPPVAGGRREASLPPPSGSTESTLQVRVVRSPSATGCGARESNPASGDRASLLATDGTCLDLDAADLEVDTANIQAFEGQGGTIDVDVTLDSVDARAFDRIAEGAFQKQVAIVMFGGVLSAPTVTSPGGFEGHLTIGGLTPELAGRVFAALSA